MSIFSGLRTSVKVRFPDNARVEYTAVSGFLFLRLFVAATMSPTLFSLWPEQVDKRVGRSLTLVAKTIQNLANLVRVAAGRGGPQADGQASRSSLGRRRST